MIATASAPVARADFSIFSGSNASPAKRPCGVAFLSTATCAGGVFRFVICDSFVEGLMAEDGAVELVLGKAAEEVADFLRSDLVGGVESAAFGELGEGGGGGDGAGATVSFPTDVADVFFPFAGRWILARVDFDFDEHLVAADRITDDAFTVGDKLGFVAHEKITRGEKVVFDDVGVCPGGLEGGFGGTGCLRLWSFGGFGGAWFFGGGFEHFSPLV